MMLTSRQVDKYGYNMDEDDLYMVDMLTSRQYEYRTIKNIIFFVDKSTS